MTNVPLTCIVVVYEQVDIMDGVLAREHYEWYMSWSTLLLVYKLEDIMVGVYEGRYSEWINSRRCSFMRCYCGFHLVCNITYEHKCF